MPRRHLTALICTLAIAAALHAEEKRAPRAPRNPKAFKGIELYSWKTEGGDFRYVLLPGTNREKDEDEVKKSGEQLKDIAALTKALAALAEGESVFWMGMKGFEFPPAKIREQIEKAAREAKVELEVSERGK